MTVNTVDRLVDKPTSVAFLGFAFIFVIISVSYNTSYVLHAFITLFYALFNHFMTLGRKHEVIGEILIGDSRWRQSFYAFFLYLPFVAWMFVVSALLLEPAFFKTYAHDLVKYLGVFIGALCIWFIVLEIKGPVKRKE